MRAHSSLWRLPLQQGKEKTVFLDCVFPLLWSLMPVKTEQLNSPIPLIDVQANSHCSDNKPDPTWKGHLQTQESTFLSLWPLCLSREWSCGLTGLRTPAWARIALCHTRHFQSFLKKTPTTPSKPSCFTVAVFRPGNTIARRAMAFTQSDDKMKMKSPVNRLNHLPSLSLCATQRWTHCK